jgi:monofunctional biosynthetic peptidoglycan transglycosylase
MAEPPAAEAVTPAAAGSDAPIAGRSEPEEATPATAAPRRRFRPWRTLAAAIAAVIALPFVLTALYAFVPPVSTLMLWRWVTLQPVTRDWVSIDDVAPVAVRSVVVSEDARFCSHGGIDMVEFNKVVDAYLDGEETRGASTIPMQLAKNLFLWPGRDMARKAAELPLAVWIDFVLPKRRVVELYLNIAEWGPEGEFGIEAASRRAFKKGAADLSRREAALLAAVLPNPIERDPAKPSSRVTRRANRIAAAADRTGGVLDCVVPPR